MVPSGVMLTQGDNLTEPSAASAGGRIRTPSVPKAKQKVMPPTPASKVRREISGSLRCCVMT